MKRTTFSSPLFLLLGVILTIQSCFIFNQVERKFEKQLDNAIKWQVKNGELILKNTAADRQAETYWAYIKRVLPNDLMDKYVTSFKLYSDGEQENLGGMTNLDDLNKTWEIDMDTIDFNLNSPDSLFILDYTHTLIHEFGHLLTLNPEQVTPTDDEFEDESGRYLTEEGYAEKNSYLGKFVKKFWKKQLLEEWDEIRNISLENKKFDRLIEFYNDNRSKFVTGYSAESPEEDIAESWTFFIMSDRPTQKAMKYRKVLFFYDFPEFVQYRTEMRKELPFFPKDYIDNHDLNEAYEE